MVVIDPWTRQKCLLPVSGNCEGGGKYYELLIAYLQRITVYDVVNLLLLYKKETTV